MDRREYMRRYQREWLARRRKEWFAGKSCSICGSVERLEADHIDPATKDAKLRGPNRGTGSMWSWAQSRLDAELTKCRVLCHDCHEKKSVTEKARGSAHGRARLNEEDVAAIREAVKRDFKQSVIAKTFDVSRSTIYDITHNRAWR